MDALQTTKDLRRTLQIPDVSFDVKSLFTDIPEDLRPPSDNLLLHCLYRQQTTLKKTDAIDTRRYYRLECSVPQPPKLYGLPKVHKPGFLLHHGCTEPLLNVYFQYNGKHYRQLHGPAIGSPVSVVVAEL